MRFWVGITDRAWYEQLSAARPDEVNFWQPTPGRPVILDAGAPFLFKLHAADGGGIVGGGYFVRHSTLPVRLAWDAFQERNGCSSLAEMALRIEHYRRSRVDVDSDVIGCMILAQPFFLSPAAMLPPPSDWSRNIVQGKTYDTTTTQGDALWSAVLAGLAPDARADAPQPRYGKVQLVHPRLGQGAFRVVVTEAYERRCAVTGERTLPVLAAAHVKPYAVSGPHDPANGVLLRTDLHTLFDRGYMTISPDLRLRVSARIRQEFENGRDYYALEGHELRMPVSGYPPPAREYLEWHANNVYRL